MTNYSSICQNKTVLNDVLMSSCHLLMWSCHNQLTLFLSAEDGSVSPSGTRYYQASVCLGLLFVADALASVPRPGALEQIGGRDGACFSSFVSQGLQISHRPTGAFLWSVLSGKDGGPHVRVCGAKTAGEWDDGHRNIVTLRQCMLRLDYVICSMGLLSRVE